MNEKLNLTNNAVEGTNGLIGQIIKNGSISTEDFSEMMNNINMNFDAKKNSKERKTCTTSQKKTYISNVMLFLARCSTNTNIIKGNNHYYYNNNYYYLLLIIKYLRSNI